METENKKSCCGSRCPRGKLFATNWLDGISSGNDFDVVEVVFKNTRMGFYTNPNRLDLKIGDMVAVEAEAQKAVASLQITDEMRSSIAHYADAIHGRWLMFLKLFYQYAVDDILSPPKKTGGIAGLWKRGVRLWHYRKQCRERQREKGTVGAGGTGRAASGGGFAGGSRKRKRS